MKRLKVFQVLECGDFSGCGRLVSNICNRLDRDRFDVNLVFAVRPGTTPAAFESLFRSPIRAIHIPSMVRPVSPLKDLAAFFRLYSLFRTERPDVVHAHSSKAGFLARLAAKLAGVPKIFYSPHGYSFRMTDANSLERSIYLFAEWVASRVGYVAVNAPNELRVAQLLASPQRTLPCYNGFDASGCEPAYPAKEGSARVLACCARITTAKNPEAFLRLCARLAGPYPGLEFVWIGDGAYDEQRNFLQEAHHLGLLSRLRLTGWLSQEGVRRELGRADVVVHYSRWDVLPTAVFEAMALGKPVVGSQAVDQISEGVTGLVASDEDELFASVCRLLDSGSLRHEMGRRARIALEMTHSFDRLIAQLEAAYSGVSREYHPDPAAAAASSGRESENAPLARH